MLQLYFSKKIRSFSFLNKKKKDKKIKLKMASGCPSVASGMGASW